jgi:hypothetical protein
VREVRDALTSGVSGAEREGAGAREREWVLERGLGLMGCLGPNWLFLFS